jgi:hypothetical protein
VLAPGPRYRHPQQRLPLKFRLLDRMLSDDPRRLRAVLAGYIFGGPSMPHEEFSRSGGILYVNRLHTWNISPAELVRGHKFGPDPHVLITHGDEFAAQFFIEHGLDPVGPRLPFPRSFLLGAPTPGLSV